MAKKGWMGDENDMEGRSEYDKMVKSTKIKEDDMIMGVLTAPGRLAKRVMTENPRTQRTNKRIGASSSAPNMGMIKNAKRAALAKKTGKIPAQVTTGDKGSASELNKKKK